MTPLPTSELTCRAAHPDPRRAGECCENVLGHLPGHYEFLGVAGRVPATPDGFVYVKCARRSCGAVNKFRLVAVEPPA